MPSHLRASEVIGHVVLDLDSGEQVGLVHDVVYRSRRGSVVGFTVSEGGFLSKRGGGFLPVGRIANVGADAITVDAGEGVDDEVPEEFDAPDRDVLDDDVYTESGSKVGGLVDVVIGLGTGVNVVAYDVETEGGDRVLVRLAAQRSVSGDALILRDDWSDHTAADLDDLGEAAQAQETHGEASRRSRDEAGHSDAPGDLERMTKAELYREAQRSEIAGRSAMTKAELLDAIRRARSGR